MPRTLRVVNPATGDLVREIPQNDPADVASALSSARRAQPAWAARGLRERLRILRLLQLAVLRERESLARLITSEQGKPVPEAMAADLLPLLDAIAFLRRRAPRILEPRPKRLSNPLLIDRKSRVLREPVGVVGIVSPWNYPLGIPGSEIVFALAAGNAVVIKPASATPLVLLRFAELAYAAGVPKDILAVLVGSGSTVGRAMAEADFDHLVFTGSVEVGEEVDRARRAQGKTCTLELGGSDAAIVLADADLERAAEGIVWSRFANAGQTCAAAKRVFVVEPAGEEFERKLAEKVAALRVGNGADPGTDVGPLIDAKAAEEMEAFVQDASAKGGRLIAGGQRLKELGPAFFAPTVLADVPPHARAMTGETFGPVLAVARVRSEDEAVARANDSAFGLTASVWTRDRTKARAIARRLQVGTVTVNDHTYTYASIDTPWMGVKASGRGATHGAEGLHDVTRPKHVNEAPARRLWPNLWWFPYEGTAVGTWKMGLAFLYGKGFRRFFVGPRLVPRILGKKRL
jgi:succinate-semialdehyde dehydrogenase/glutarate-semialdehyde dehydrogenase